MSWITKILGVDKMVDEKMRRHVMGLSIPDLTYSPALQEYRAMEYRAWASTNPNLLWNFYRVTNPPANNFVERSQFWSFVSDLKIPKLHYPAPEALMNHMKALLFGSKINITLHKDGASESETIAINTRLQKLFEDIKIDELLHKGSDLATYSGTVVPKIMIDPLVHDKPIVELYPRERVEIITRWGKPIQYIFKDYYHKNNKKFTLHTIFGKGSILYELYNEKGKQVPLTEIGELAGLENFTFKENVILTTHLKNKTTNNEFPDSPYGGSDFEGNIDTFHMIDEVYSSLILYIRRNHPLQAITEDILPVSDDGKSNYVPKEYEFSTIKMRKLDGATSIKDKLYRDNPELKVQPFLDSILSLSKVVYHNVGMSYTTVGLEGVSANASGASLEVREKSTIIVRNNKIRNWDGFLKSWTPILLMMDDLIIHKRFVSDYKDWQVRVTFPEYNGQSYIELVEELAKAKQAGLVTTAYAVDKLYTKEGLTEEQRAEMVRDIKIENGETILESEFE